MFPVKRHTFRMGDDEFCYSDTCSYSSQISPRSLSPELDEKIPDCDTEPLIGAADKGQSSNGDGSEVVSPLEEVKPMVAPKLINDVSRRSEANHPLLHSLVLFNTLQYLPLKDLLNCRLVCSTWDAEVCRLLRKNLTLEFQDICHISNFKQLMDDNKRIKPDREVPFARINLRSTFRLGHDIAQDFFKIHGHVIKHMKIAKVGCDCGANFFQKLLFYQTTNLTSLDLQIISSPIRLSPLSEYTDKYVRVKRVPRRLSPKWKLPNLTRLHLRHQLFFERPKFVEDLLEAVVNLEELTTDEAASPLFSRNCFMPAVLASRNRWTKLKRLLVGDLLCLSNEQIVKVLERNLQLECLPLLFNLSVTPFERLDIQNLLNLLKCMQNSLKKLELYNHRPDILIDFQKFPEMKALEFFKITNIHFPTILLDRLPKLSCFAVNHEDNSMYVSLYNLKIPPHPSLSSFSLAPVRSMTLTNLRNWTAFWHLRGESCIEDIAAAFPHLRSLSLNGSDTVLKSIFEKLPLLEELTICGPITDEGVTGIPLAKCQQMNAEKDYGLLEPEELEGLKFVGDLKNLKRLKMSIFGTPSVLTDVSVFLGFLCCKDLISLDIGNKELTTLWEQEVKRLRGYPQPS